MKLRTSTVTWMAVLALLVGTQAAFSQGMRRSPEERAKQLKEQLSLTDEQTKKVTQIYTASQDSMMAMMQSGGGDRSAMRGMFQKETERVDKEIEKILTKEQVAKFEEVKKQRQQMRRQPREG